MGQVPRETAWIDSLAGKNLVFTGIHPDYQQADLETMARRHGAGRITDDLNRKTDILVRCGHNSQWVYGSYGRKEEKVAEFQRMGLPIVIIDGAGFLSVVSGRRAPVIAPHHPSPRAGLM